MKTAYFLFTTYFDSKVSSCKNCVFDPPDYILRGHWRFNDGGSCIPKSVFKNITKRYFPKRCPDVLGSRTNINLVGTW